MAPDHDPAPGDPTGDPGDDLARLRAEVAALRAQLATEVRTRRVVVVDAGGRPRVVLSADPGVGSVRLDDAGGTASVELYAVDPLEGDGPEVGVVLVVDGDVVRSLHQLVNHRSTR